MTSNEEELKKQQQDKWIELFRKEKEQQAKCDSDSTSEKCKECNCWKMKRYIYDEFFPN